MIKEAGWTMRKSADDVGETKDNEAAGGITECMGGATAVQSKRNEGEEVGSDSASEDEKAWTETEVAQLTVESQGTLPLFDPAERGRLEYPISIKGVCAVALLDHGSGRSFVASGWYREHGLETTQMERPVRVVQFMGGLGAATHVLHSSRVRFAGGTQSLEFLVLSYTPAPVVIGLDAIRSWQLCHNPLNNHVLMLPSSDPHVKTLADHETDLEQLREEVVDDGGRLEGADIVAGHSVTATTPLDVEQNEEIIGKLDSRLQELVKKFPVVFSPPDSIPPEREVKHAIRLKPFMIPVRRAAYLLSSEKCEAMRKQIADLADVGWVVPSCSPWGAPILFVRKKGGEWRLCVDFRDLNALTIDDSFPLPRVETLLHRSGDARVFSKIDLASGFHQIALEDTFRAATAFRLPEPVYGCTHWEWTVMPFGLKNAPPTFQRAITSALQGCEDFAVVYIDDILVYSADESEYVVHLERVFEQLQRCAFHTCLAKCELMKGEVEFLGHSLSANGLTTTEPKMQVLQAWQPPLKNAKQVRQFIGLAAWYRNFIPHLVTLAAPLTRLTSARSKFAWSPEASHAVEAIQRLVSQAPCLARWEGSRETRVIADASKLGVGAVGWNPPRLL